MGTSAGSIHSTCCPFSDIFTCTLLRVPGTEEIHLCCDSGRSRNTAVNTDCDIRHHSNGGRNCSASPTCRNQNDLVHVKLQCGMEVFAPQSSGRRSVCCGRLAK